MEAKVIKTVFKVTALVGVPITAYLSARGALTKAELLKLRAEDAGVKEKVIDNARAYGPAAAAGAATMASIILADYFGAKEVALAGALAAGAVARKDKIKRDFDRYRGVVKEEDGDQRDIDILQKSSAIRLDDEGEVLHTYCIDWKGCGDPIYFEATAKDVAEGLSRINRELVDYSTGWGIVTMTEALEYLGHKELATEYTDKAGWSYDLLNVQCDCYYLDFYIYPGGSTVGRDHEDPNTFFIDVTWGPEEDLDESLRKAKSIGII